jgi:hypothetical protein
MSESARRLLVRGIAAAKSGDNDQARFHLEWVLRTDSSSDQKAEAWYWLSEISEDLDQKRELLQLVLSHNPLDQRVRKKMAILNGELEPEDIIDPDHFSQKISPTPEQATANRFECQACGGHMTYTPDGQALVCEYCRNHEQIKSSSSPSESNFLVSMATAKGHSKAYAIRAFECQACGAVFMLVPETLTMSCPHCAATYTTKQTDTRQIIPPQGIIPAAVSKKQALDFIKVWLNSRKVSSDSHINKLVGVYLPVWTFDITGDLPWNCLQYKSQGHSSISLGFGSEGDNITSQKEWMPVKSNKYVHFDDILIPGSAPTPSGFTKILTGYDCSGIKQFNPSYLSNWLAESYTTKLSDAALDARVATIDRAEALIKRNIFGGPVKDFRLDSSKLIIESYKLILVPVWLTSYIHDERQYKATVNAQTGLVEGQLPPNRLQKMIDWLLE